MPSAKKMIVVFVATLMVVVVASRGYFLSKAKTEAKREYRENIRRAILSEKAQKVDVFIVAKNMKGETIIFSIEGK